MYRGSRKHILDWVATPRFIPELLEIASPVKCRVTPSSRWQPVSYRFPDEARLEEFGPRVLPNVDWTRLSSWWLKHEKGANTPNWDIALSCEINDVPGLLLVEAKANAPELKEDAKTKPNALSPKSVANHEQIKVAIGEARHALRTQFPDIAIDRDTSYQLSNRIAFAWKLATMGVPTVLIYLGFTEDLGIANTGAPFSSADDWGVCFGEHLTALCPHPIAERRIPVGDSAFWLLVRSKKVLEISPQVI
jgi:hypothetical protein